MDEATVSSGVSLAWVPGLVFGVTLLGCADPGPADQLEPAGFRGLEDGLELHWTFEDSVGSQITDLSGNGRHGTLQAGASLVASPNGQAVSLDGVDDWISLVGPRAPALYGGVDGSFTISARLRVTDTARYNTLCYGCGPFSTMYVGTQPYGPVVLSALDDQSSAGWKWPKSSTNVLADDAWAQVTMVVEDGGEAHYYLDCVHEGQLIDANIGLIDIGYSSVGKGALADRWFGGEIDELRIWNRALIESELAQLCPISDPLTQDLEMHWTFEDRVGQQILDLSGNGRHGTAVGGSFVGLLTGEALSLDGVDDKVSFVGPRALSIYGGEQGDFTISARVKVADVNKYNTLCFGCGPLTTMYVGDPSPGARIMSVLKNLDTQANAWATSTSVLADDTWAEVTLVVEGGVAAYTYHDCTLDSSLEGVNVGLKDPGYSSIGESANPSWWYEGEIDELRVWSRALDQSEIDLLCPRGLCDGPIHVDVDAPPDGDGLTWATAFDNVQDAVDASAACVGTVPQLWLAEGQYAPEPNNRPVVDTEHPIEIYGGFSGVETSLAQRDFIAHPVRLGADGWQNNVIEIDDNNTPATGSARIDGITISGGIDGAIEIESLSFWQGSVFLANLTITDNVGKLGTGLLMRGGPVVLTNSTFERNIANGIFDPYGGAIYVISGQLTVENSSFIDNSADLYGGAIYFRKTPGNFGISGSTFSGNTAEWGGAVYIASNHIATYTFVDTTFEANTAGSGGGAIYMEETSSTFDSVVFVDNTGKFGGAIHLADSLPNETADKLEIINSRFIGNHAINGNGGALRLQEVGTTVTNTEFTANEASTVGGAVFGRGAFVSTTFSGNVALSGSGLYANAGPDMFMNHTVAYPDTIVGAGIYAPYSCTKSNLLGTPRTQLGVVDPFAAADLDLDGRIELYLDPEGPCAGLEGGVIDEFDWTVLTVEPSQCTDVGWPEPGVHYSPQSIVGACE